MQIIQKCRDLRINLGKRSPSICHDLRINLEKRLPSICKMCTPVSTLLSLFWMVTLESSYRINSNSPFITWECCFRGILSQGRFFPAKILFILGRSWTLRNLAVHHTPNVISPLDILILFIDFYEAYSVQEDFRSKGFDARRVMFWNQTLRLCAGMI